jgi:cysteine desulfurase
LCSPAAGPNPTLWRSAVPRWPIRDRGSHIITQPTLDVRAGTRLQPIIHGGGQEHGLRVGTENVALIAALGAAAQIAHAELPESAARLQALRERLHRQVDEQLPGRVRLNGHPSRRLPGTLNVSITGIRGRELLAAVPAIAAATGSACHEGLEQPSPVLTAMGIDTERAAAALRLSLGRWSTPSEMDQAAHLIATHAQHAPAREPAHLLEEIP